MTDTCWTDNRIDILRKNYPHYSATQVSKMLAETGASFTRCAVIGKARRIGIDSCKPVVVPRKRVQAKKPRRHKSSRVSTFTAEWGDGPTPPRFPTQDIPIQPCMPLVKLIDLSHKHCRFPIGEPGTEEFAFCGCQKLDGFSYCEFHRPITIKRKAIKHA
jgi:GcrA cell cycle regulator